jgi:hypothetical protein
MRNRMALVRRPCHQTNSGVFAQGTTHSAVLPGISSHRLTRFFAEKEPRAVMTRFTLTLRSAVAY